MLYKSILSKVGATERGIRIRGDKEIGDKETKEPR
jgi:hypothetical protein